MPWSVAAKAVAGVVAGSVASSIFSDDSPSSQTSSQKVEIDPRIQAILYGNGRTLKNGVTPIYKSGNGFTEKKVWQGGADHGEYVTKMVPVKNQVLANPDSDYTNDTGLIGRIAEQLDQPQNAGLMSFGNNANTYLGGAANTDFNNMRTAAAKLQNSNITAPQMGSPGYMQAARAQSAQIDAPGQNDLNLAPAYQDIIYGNPAENPYLTGAIQKGINQSNTAFGNMLADATKNLTQNVMPSIRGGAQMSGQYGGNRQALSEGKALDTFNTGVGRALSQYGQNNTDAAVSAQAGAYDAGQNRALSAVGNLNSNQYGTATQNAGFNQQTNLANAGFANDANRTNYAGQLQANQSNQQAQLSTNQLNAANQLNGINAANGLMNQAYGYGTNQDQYDFNKVGKVSELIRPYAGLGSTSTSSQPLYSNTGGNILGGITGGLGLLNAYNNTGGMNLDKNGTGIASGTAYDPLRGWA